MKYNDKKAKLLTTLVVAATIAVGCSSPKNDSNNNNNNSNNATTQQTTQTTTANSVEQASANYTYISGNSFVVGANGELVKNADKVDNAKTIEWYLDPYCPACAKYEEVVGPKVPEIHKKGLNIRYNMLSFLSTRSADDYSNRAASFMLAVAETSPQIAQKFLQKVVHPDFQPGHGAASKTGDEKFQEVFKQVGGKDEDWNKVAELQKKLLDSKVVASKTAVAFNDKDLLSKSETGRLSTPFIVVGDSAKALNFIGADDVQNHTIKSIDKYLETKGFNKPTEEKKNA